LIDEGGDGSESTAAVGEGEQQQQQGEEGKSGRTLSPEHLPKPGIVPETVSHFESEIDLTRDNGEQASSNTKGGLFIGSSSVVELTEIGIRCLWLYEILGGRDNMLIGDGVCRIPERGDGPEA
jgi:hypothetical protein